jgi:hypothetical protein
MKFDHEKFFQAYRQAFGTLRQSQVDGLESLLTGLDLDNAVNDVRWAAYMLATVKHECADTWQPIEEYGKGRGREYGKPVVVEDGQGNSISNVYYGRGYVQLTWKDNYQKIGQALGLGDELMISPEQVLKPDIAYRVMSHGMRHGTFTGASLARYIDASHCDYRNARRIINGLDRCDTIADYARSLQAVLTSAQV